MTRRIFRQIGAGKFLLPWGISLLFGLSGRTGGPPALTLHVLAVLNDQYYALFAVLPALLFLCGGLMEDEPETLLLRCGSFSRYFFARWRALAAVTTMLWLGQLGALGLSRLTNLKTRACILINFTYESVKYFNFLGSGAVGIFDCLMNNNFFNESIEHFSSQFRGVGVLLD